MDSKSKGAILITGCSSGIGFAAARRFDALGFRVFAGIRNESDIPALKQNASPALTPLLLDVTRPDQIESALRTIQTETDSLVALINNAGISINGPLEYLDVNELRRQMEINVFGLLAITQACLPMLRRSKGRIVNMSSVAGFFVTPLLGPYCASKHALEAMTDALRRELKSCGVRVALIQPAAVQSRIWEKAMKDTEALLSNATAEMRAHYGTLIDAVSEAAKGSQRRASPPEGVLRALEHAVTSRNPKPRYPIGFRSRLLRCVSLLPDRFQDRLIERTLKL